MLKRKGLFPAMLFLAVCADSHSLFADEPISLKELVGETLSAYPDVMASYNRMQIAKAGYKMVKAGRLPTIDLKSGWGTQHRNSSVAETTHMNSHDLSLSLSQPLFEGGGIDNGIEQSNHLYLASRQEWLKTSQDTALYIAQAYFGVLEKRRLLELSEENYKIHEETRDKIKLRVEQGLASEVDLFQLDSRVARAAMTVVIARNSVDDEESQFLTVTGRLPGILLPLPKNMDKTLPYQTLEAAKQRLTLHPEIQSASLNVDAAESAYQASMAGYYPAVSLEVSRSWATNSGGTKGSTDDFQIMLNMRYNLYRGGADKAAISESSYRMAEQEDILEKGRRQINENAEISWSAYRYLNLQMPFLEQQVNYGSKTLAAYEEQFSLGQRDLVVLLDSANELFQAQQAHTSARHQIAYTRLRLLSATGDLLPWFGIMLNDERASRPTIFK